MARAGVLVAIHAAKVPMIPHQVTDGRFPECTGLCSRSLAGNLSAKGLAPSEDPIML